MRPGATNAGKASAVVAAAGVPAPAASSSAPAGGVLGETASGSSQPVGGVLGAIASVGSGVLPFTGFPLWYAVLAGLMLIALGLALNRRGRAAA